MLRPFKVLPFWQGGLQLRCPPEHRCPCPSMVDWSCERSPAVDFENGLRLTLVPPPHTFSPLPLPCRSAWRSSAASRTLPRWQSAPSALRSTPSRRAWWGSGSKSSR